MNYPLCFSTIQTILDWVTGNPAYPQEPLLEELEELRTQVEYKIKIVSGRLDKKGKMGQKDPS